MKPSRHNKKRGHKTGEEESSDDDDLDDRLMADDYELLEENLGRRVKRTFKRVKVIDDSDSDEDQAESDARNKIADELFDLDDEPANEHQYQSNDRAQSPSKSYSSEESSEDDIDDFVVDDSGAPIRRLRMGEVRITDERLQVAQDIFGVDFDINEFAEEQEDEDDSDDDDQPRRKSKSKTPGTFQQIYEPFDLERLHFTTTDALINKTDIPERIQRRRVPQFPKSEFPIKAEASWIFDELNRTKKRFGRQEMENKEAAIVEIETEEDKSWETGTVLLPSKSLNAENDTADAVSTIRGHAVVEKSDEMKNNETVIETIETGEDRDWETGSVLLTSIHTNKKKEITDAGSLALSHLAVEKSEEMKNNEEVIERIEQVLKLMKYDAFELPFILRYRKDVYKPQLTVTDLRDIAKLDVTYCQLHKSKMTLKELVKSSMEFLEDVANKDRVEALLGRGYRNITATDFDVISDLSSVEEINDFRSFYSLHYGIITSDVKAFAQAKKISIEKERNNWDGENNLIMDLDEGKTEEVQPTVLNLKNAHQRRPCVGRYENYKRLLTDLLPDFGMSSSDFALNVKYAYAKISPNPATKSRLEAAGPFTSQNLPSREKVLEAAGFVLATQLSRELEIRKALRQNLWEKGALSVTPTETGMKLIDESHPLYSMKYLRNKPVKTFVMDEFLKLISAEQERLVEIMISQEFVDNLKETLVEEWISNFIEDGFSSVVQDWNTVKRQCVEQAVFEMALPSLVRELKMRLEKDSKNFVIEACAEKVRSCINVGKFQFTYDPENPEDKDVPSEWSSERGIRVMAIAYDSNPDLVPFACVLNPDGSVVEHIGLKNLLIFGKPSQHDLDLKESTVTLLRDFITTSKPHVIVIGGESCETYDLEHEVKEILLSIQLEDDEFPPLSVEILDNDAAKVYSNCNRGVSDFRDNPVVLRQAISLGRRLLDPLVELGQLFNFDEDILCLKLHRFQGKILKEDLLNAIEEEFVLCVNEVGLDFNRCLADSRVAQLLQFISGLGPSKATFLLQVFMRKPSKLKNRSQLAGIGRMGPCVFKNCAGFIKVMWREFEISDHDETFIEYLDCTRIHPEHYEHARKIAADSCALEDEDGNTIDNDTTEDEHVKMALDDPIEAVKKMKLLSMPLYAEALCGLGYPNLNLTLEDIISEFEAPYKDPREPYTTSSIEEIFKVLTKETTETLYKGKLLLATVVGFCGGCRVPSDSREPEKLGERNWGCPVCKKDGFEDYNKVYDHYDAPRGVYLKLDNGLKGYISSENLSDHKIIDVNKRVRRGQPVHCRIIDFNMGTRKVNLTSRSSDLRGDNLMPLKDKYYDKELETEDLAKMKKNQSRRLCPQYRIRPIMHPSFHNISYAECAARMESMEVGDAIFRPSSKGTTHLTLSWKIMNGLLNHVDVVELGKSDEDLNIGRVLVVDREEYEDLDEILTRYVYRISSNVRELLNHKYYIDVGENGKSEVEEILKKKLSENQNQLHYVFSVLKKYAGKFLLSYLISTSKLKVVHEVISVVPDGYRYRGETLESLLDLLRYFKTHYRDPPPTFTPLSQPSSSFR